MIMNCMERIEYIIRDSKSTEWLTNNVADNSKTKRSYPIHFVLWIQKINVFSSLCINYRTHSKFIMANMLVFNLFDPVM